MSHRLGIYCEHEEFQVILKIEYPYAKCFKEHLWVDGEIIEDYRDENYLIYKSTVIGKTSIVKWILEMGSSVTVIEPKEIKDAIVLEIENMRNKYLNKE